MSLSRIVMKRGGQEATIQGMIHAGPKSFYDGIQREVDQATARGDQIFYEGVKEDDLPLSTENEVKIGEFFDTLLDLIPEFADAVGLVFQGGNIEYPADAINADMTFQEMVRRMDQNGFKCDVLLTSLRKIDREKIQQKIQNDIEATGGDISGVKSKLPFRLFVKFALRKAMPVIRKDRNKVVADVVKTHSTGKNILIHYGENHVEGIVKLLKKDGWRVQSMNQLNLADFS